jgi:ankyrin repeat protein
MSTAANYHGEEPGVGPLHVSTLKGYDKIVMCLLQAGADVNARTFYGSTPLHFAARKGHVSIAAMLLQAGAEPDARDVRGDTPLTVASAAGHKHIVSVLLKATALKLGGGGDGTEWEPAMPGALVRAAENGNVQRVMQLIAGNVDVDDRHGEDRDTALHCAARNGRFGVVSLLLIAGADKTLRNARCHMPLHCAAISGHTRIVSLLLHEKQRAVTDELLDRFGFQRRSTPCA